MFTLPKRCPAWARKAITLYFAKGGKVTVLPMRQRSSVILLAHWRYLPARNGMVLQRHTANTYQG